MIKYFLALAIFLPTLASAQTIHLSPAVKLGPYSFLDDPGGEIQFGFANAVGLDAAYASFGHSSFGFFDTKERIKTYRFGGQYKLKTTPFLGPFMGSEGVAIQLEAGLAEYEGTKTNVISSNQEYRSTYGASAAFSWVRMFTPNLGMRITGELNYLDRDNTHLPYNTSAMLSTGLTLRF
ncbi:hypothetical protein J4N42_10970 [Vibrio sp. SCSIO 43135]|uniref:hypothetical protein n=1 Tax=Vibrio sp. SCSIO 43135 TaxID=2819096 RepID=UPI002075180D|nr:hypothetical protein [Vibrio sp. SCSIO 43135]USD40568.1 hypothetical protein J4N42_10970 [Vibrio sp. SCSIO 43135]